MRLFLLTILSMMAFAANSVFGRLALADGAIDAAGYSLLRLLAGAVMLALLVLPRGGVMNAVRNHGNWISAAALFGYAAAFSYAYLALETGMGALILFACVQATMIGWSIQTGSRPSGTEWIGLAIAFAAFVWLVSPGLSAPDPLGAILMAFSGIAWGVYSLRGKGAKNPLAATAGNFILSLPMAVVLTFFSMASLHFTTFGIVMAVASGAITSALGYALWYLCLRELTSTRAAIVQLTVPAIATLGGVLFSAEPLTMRLVLCSVLILGGVAIAISAKEKTA